MAAIAFSQAGPSRLSSTARDLLPSSIHSWRNTLLTTARTWSAAPSTPWYSLSAASSSAAATATATAPAPATPLQSALNSLLEFFPPFLLAVPKHKVTHSRKSMRSANKGLKNRSNITNCPACGSPKLSHHACPTCFSQINRRWKEESKASGRIENSQTPEVVIRHEQ